MLTQTVNYTDYNGIKRTEKLYFNLTQAELLEMELDSPNGLEKEIKAIIDRNDARAIVNKVKEFMLKAYGVKSDDGKRLIKNAEVRDAFVQSEAYSKLFMELLTDDKKCAAFFSAIVPATASASAQPMALSATNG